MKRILVAIAITAMSSSAIFAAGACTGPNATTPGGTTGELDIYGSGVSGADINNASVSNGTILPVDTIGTCTVNGAVFSNFQVVTNTITGPQPTGFNLALAVIGGTTAQFTYSVTGADVLNDFELFYQIGGGGALGSGVTSMTLNGESSTQTTEFICSAASANPANPQTGCPNGTTLGQLTSNIAAEQQGPVTFGSVVTDFVNKDIQGGSEVQQQPGSVSGVPEPMTLSLLGVGLLGIGLLGRRARS